MQTITATRDTWLKRSPAQSSALPDDRKTHCPTGTKLEVESYAPSPGGHWEVKIDGETWFIFDAATHGPSSHWQCSWEEDGPEENDEPIKPENIAKAKEAQAILTPVGMGLKPGDSFDTLITEHFTYGEMCNYQEARRFASAGSVRAAYELLIFLEKVRSHFGGKPTRITSGHRPPTINRSIGGATYSEHLFRAPGIGALDFYVDGVSIHDVQDYCDRNWPHSVGYGAPRGFVHLGIGRGRVRWDY